MIVVCGEALIDVFVGHDTAGGVAMDGRLGGSPFNVAVGLARLGQPAALFGAVSRGALGERLMRALRSEGVATDCTVRVDAPTTLGLVALGADGAADYAFYGAEAADRQLTPAALAAAPAAQAYAFGSYAMVVAPAAQTLRALVEREHGRSVIAYDPNVRLHVEPRVQTWRDTLSWMVPRTTILKLSDEDLQRLHPGAGADELAAAWQAAGVALVVLTRGAHGCIAWSRHGRVELPARPVKVIDTVGAGDTFQAALLAALAERGQLTPGSLQDLRPDALREVLSFAMRAAAITCSRRGADLPRRAELD